MQYYEYLLVSVVNFIITIVYKYLTIFVVLILMYSLDDEFDDEMMLDIIYVVLTYYVQFISFAYTCT